MKRIVSVILLCVLCIPVIAQELNLGVHGNLIFTSPVVSSKSVRQDGLHVGPFRPGYNVGANLNVKFKKSSVEFAANYVYKQISLAQKAQTVSGGSGFYRITVPGTAFEFPVLINLLGHRHDKKSVYDFYYVLGAAYEIFSVKNGISSTTSSTGSQSIFVKGGYRGKAVQHMAAAIAGFKINAVLKKVGLIDYGLTFHFPLQLSGPYTSEGNYTSGTTSKLFSNSLYVYPSYIDVKFCYYLLNFDKKGKRVRYRLD